MTQAIETAKGATAVLAGQAAGRMIVGFIPVTGGPIVEAAKGVGAAVLLKMIGRQFLPADLANYLAIGALVNPMKDLIVSVVPQAGGFLGAYSSGPMYLPPMGAANRIGVYASDGQEGFEDENLSSYSGDVYN